MSSVTRNIVRYSLAAFMAFAGINHFTSVSSFKAQVPPFLPNPELVIYVSGVIEIGLALALIVLKKYRVLTGFALATFYLVIFPGNISQFLTHTSAFGLDTDLSRFIRLLFQPVLMWLALWSTGADIWVRSRFSSRS